MQKPFGIGQFGLDTGATILSLPVTAPFFGLP
jgi:hypothetical protein